MVKKIDSKRPGSVGGNSPVEGGKAVGAAKVGEVSAVRGSTAAQGSQSVERRLTAKNRQQLMAIVEEESHRLVEEGQLPERKKRVVEGAVKMALDASIPETDEE